MSEQIDLDAYLRRIGYTGSREPTVEALRGLHLRHPQAIAFENLNPLLRWPVGIDLPWLEQKIVQGGRGGWCFEQNLLFAYALKALGFHVTGLAARILWNQPEDAITPRGHMLLRVTIEGETYVADVGFGGQTLTGPLRLEPDIEQQTPHELFRIVQADGYYKMQSKIGDDWKTLYRFDLQEQFPQDYEITSYFLSSHPRSHFLNSLIAARPASDRRYTLFNNQFAVHHLGAPTERRVLTSAREIRAVLEREFLLTVPDHPELDTVLEQLIGASSA